MKASSYLKALGYTVAGVAVGAVLALPASAEPPSHGFNTRPPRPTVDRKPAPHKPHAQHKPRTLHPGNKGDHPAHKTVNRPPRLVVEKPVIAPRPQHVPERLVILKRPHEVMPHAPHYNQAPPQVTHVLPPHQPHKAHKQGRPVPQVSSGKQPVQQEVVISAPK